MHLSGLFRMAAVRASALAPAHPGNRSSFGEPGRLVPVKIKNGVDVISVRYNDQTPAFFFEDVQELVELIVSPVPNRQRPDEILGISRGGSIEIPADLL